MRKGRSPSYGAEVEEVIWRIWQAAEQPCGKRLVALRALWVPFYEKPHGKLRTEVAKQVYRIGEARVDRLLDPRKARVGARGGDFIWSLTSTDIYSGWTANRAVWNQGAEGIVQARREVEQTLPFELLGF